MKRAIRVEALRCAGWELYQLPSDKTPQGFIAPAYRLTAPDGRTWRNVSADKLSDALDQLFEECA